MLSKGVGVGSRFGLVLPPLPSTYPAMSDMGDEVVVVNFTVEAWDPEIQSCSPIGLACKRDLRLTLRLVRVHEIERSGLDLWMAVDFCTTDT